MLPGKNHSIDRDCEHQFDFRYIAFRNRWIGLTEKAVLERNAYTQLKVYIYPGSPQYSRYRNLRIYLAWQEPGAPSQYRGNLIQGQRRSIANRNGPPQRVAGPIIVPTTHLRTRTQPPTWGPRAEFRVTRRRHCIPSPWNLYTPSLV